MWRRERYKINDATSVCLISKTNTVHPAAEPPVPSSLTLSLPTFDHLLQSSLLHQVCKAVEEKENLDRASARVPLSLRLTRVGDLQVSVSEGLTRHQRTFLSWVFNPLDKMFIIVKKIVLKVTAGVGKGVPA